ncbi:putative bifunctional diguanylate cyclase/phosphodiesterase [Roseibium aggregatum]|uniref:GGDEF domain-containing protein n=1 Tax=Roseibium aggregatum TaxID=187304 RepID=A0A939EFA2_9HYPH|nr:bifunctional diguanylate cyclase/phosphodiesterase [Roseibium aggregatum]MBN9672095.1 GGDEF domain-containing protein [Roseibium aggregatum]
MERDSRLSSPHMFMLAAVSVLAGISMWWMLSFTFVNSTKLLKAQSASQEMLTFLAYGRNQLDRLDVALNAVASDNSQERVRSAQEIYQSLLDSLQVAGATAPLSPAQTHSELLDVNGRLVSNLETLREDFVRLANTRERGHAVRLARQVGSIRSHLDAVDWRLIHEMTSESQNKIVSTGQAQQVAVASIVILALLAFTVSFTQSVKLREQREKLLQSAAKTRRVMEADGLTALANRDAFLHAVSDLVEHPRASDGFGVIVLKIGGLKRTNVQFGYGFGDEVIAGLANELQNYISTLDHRNKTARTGNVEFAFLLHGVNTEAELCIVAHILVAIVNVPIEREDFVVTLDGHAGIAVGDGDEVCARDLVLHADLAMQDASRRGPNEVVVFSEPLRSGQTRRRTIEDRLRSAVLGNQIYPVYQPQFDMASGRMVGMEALARWHCPEFGMIPPQEFIAAAERIGAIVQIGQHILKTACEDAVSMRGGPSVSVNLSVLQIVQDNVPAFTKQVLETTGLPPARLKLEVTESVIIGDSKRVYETLAGLKELGVSISLDDFGTGYSALSYLTDFDWDELKIDRSFVEKALQSDRARHVARTIGALAEKMKARLTVEGIETRSQRDLFADIGYQVAQGYFYAKPMLFSELNSSPYVLTSNKLLPQG